MIGKVITIQKSANKNQIGLKGRIIDETLYAFLLKTNGGKKMILKRNVIFKMKGSKMKIYGTELEKRPYKRI